MPCSGESATGVAVTTLDDLIARYGEPVFCKIDVEGYEASRRCWAFRPLQAVSVEYVPAARHIAVECIRRLDALGAYAYNWTIGEQHRWQSTAWLSADDMIQRLASLPVGADSGDIYARLRPSRNR